MNTDRFSDDETRLLNNPSAPATGNNTTNAAATGTKTPAAKKKDHTAAAAAAGVGVGAVLGAAATYAADHLGSSEVVEEAVDGEAVAAVADEEKEAQNEAAEGKETSFEEASATTAEEAPATAQAEPVVVRETVREVHHHHYHEVPAAQGTTNDNNAMHARYEAAAPQTQAQHDDNTIEVLGVERVNVDGHPMNMAVIQNQAGEQALLVDVDDNGTIDVMLYDANGDHELQANEVFDASGADITVGELIAAAPQNPGYQDHTGGYYASDTTVTTQEPEANSVAMTQEDNYTEDPAMMDDYSATDDYAGGDDFIDMGGDVYSV